MKGSLYCTGGQGTLLHQSQTKMVVFSVDSIPVSIVSIDQDDIFLYTILAHLDQVEQVSPLIMITPPPSPLLITIIFSIGRAKTKIIELSYRFFHLKGLSH